MPDMPPPVRRPTPNLTSMLLAVVLVVAGIGALYCLGVMKHPVQPKRDANGWLVPHEETDTPADACQAGAFAAYNGCRNELNDQWYDAGSVDEPKVQKAKDYDRCHRVEEDTFHACNQYRKD